MSMRWLGWGCAVLMAPVAFGQIDPFNTKLALADVVHRAVSLATVRQDPFQRQDLQRRTLTHEPENVCKEAQLQEGLQGGGCLLIVVRECGERCVDLLMNQAIYRQAQSDIDASLAAPCSTLRKARLPAYDNHPRTFFLSYRRSLQALACDITPIAIDGASYQNGRLRVRYHGD